jgi:hypothetical protein
VHFRIRGEEYDVPWRTIVDYGPALKGMPVARTVTHTVGGPPSKRALTQETWTIRDLVHRVAPEREFTLSHFGLPELEEGFAVERSFLWAYLIGMGVLVGIGAIVVFWKFRNVPAGPARPASENKPA